MMKKTLALGAIITTVLMYSTTLQAHGRYILPSHTMLSGEATQPVTLTASISNDVFHPDKPLGNNGGGDVNAFLAAMFKKLQASVIQPDGTTNDAVKWHAFSRQSVADLSLAQAGTYRVSIVQPATPMVTFKKADGSGARLFGSQPTLPEGASDIVYRTVAARVETYISHNGANRQALASVGQGIELSGDAHPNDLFVGEPARFQLLLDGKPLKQTANVQLTRGGTRHRNKREMLSVATDKEGLFTVAFQDAGFYLLEVEHEAKGEPGSGVDVRHFSLYVTLEVFPE